MTWQDPKNNWQAGDGIKAGDLNRIENNIHLHDTRITWANISANVSNSAAFEAVGGAVAVPPGKTIYLRRASIFIKGSHLQNNAESDSNYIKVLPPNTDITYKKNAIMVATPQSYNNQTAEGDYTVTPVRLYSNGSNATEVCAVWLVVDLGSTPASRLYSAVELVVD